jgi:hypothetical protein
MSGFQISGSSFEIEETVNVLAPPNRSVIKPLNGKRTVAMKSSLASRRENCVFEISNSSKKSQFSFLKNAV